MRGWDLFRKERLYKGLRLRYRPSVRSGCLSVCPWQETPNPQMWFLGSSCNFKLLSFLKFPFSAVFVTLSSFSPVFCHLCFFAFRNVSCYLECSKFISPKWFFTCKIFFTELFCISECFMLSWVLKIYFTQMIFHLQNFFHRAVGEARRDTMLPSILVQRKSSPLTKLSGPWCPQSRHLFSESSIQSGAKSLDRKILFTGLCLNCFLTKHLPESSLRTRILLALYHSKKGESREKPMQRMQLSGVDNDIAGESVSKKFRQRMRVRFTRSFLRNIDSCDALSSFPPWWGSRNGSWCGGPGKYQSPTKTRITKWGCEFCCLSLLCVYKVNSV